MFNFGYIFFQLLSSLSSMGKNTVLSKIQKRLPLVHKHLLKQLKALIFKDLIYKIN